MRSKNAGPFLVTVDMFFDTAADYERVANWPSLAVETARRLDVDAEVVQVYRVADIRAVKITVPRRVVSGSLGDVDVYGCQQHVPLLTIDVP
jgi:hypothetical protein